MFIFHFKTDTPINTKIKASQDTTSMALTAASSVHRLQPSPVKEIHQNTSSQEQLANPPSSLISATPSPKPLSPSNRLETNPEKRIRKLKKKKCLNKAKLNKQPEISESELDAEQPAPRPTRKCRPHRRSSSTYVSPPPPEEKDENEEMVVTEASKAQSQETKLATPPVNEDHSESSELEMVELPPPWYWYCQSRFFRPRWNAWKEGQGVSHCVHNRPCRHRPSKACLQWSHLHLWNWY